MSEQHIPVDVAALDHVLSTARSVRRNLDFERDIPLQVLGECIEVATQAPMGIGGESWRFLVVKDPGKKQQLAELYRTVIGEFQAERG